MTERERSEKYTEKADMQFSAKCFVFYNVCKKVENLDTPPSTTIQFWSDPPKTWTSLIGFENPPWNFPQKF